MICRQCGRYMPDNSRFCPGCGASVHVDAPATPAQPVPQTVSQPQQQMLPLDKIPDSPRLVALKKLARSPMMLIAALAFTLGFLMNIWVSFSVSTQMSAMMEEFLKAVSSDVPNMNLDLSLNTSGAALGIVLSMLPSLLVVIALWITYFSAFKKIGMSTAGLTIVKVLQIVALVAQCLIAGLVLLFMGIGILGASMDGSREGMTMVIVLTAIIAVAFAFVIIYFARVIGTINAATEIITNGRTPKRASVYVAVVLIIGAVGSALATLPYLSMAAIKDQLIQSLVQSGEIPANFAQLYSGINFTAMVLPQLLNAVATFMFGILIFSYRSNVQDMIVAPPAPAYAHEVYRPSAPAVVPVATKPAQEVPATEKPAETPAVEVPKEEAPAEEAPASVEEPAPEAPAAEESPVVEEPVAEEPAAETVSAE